MHTGFHSTAHPPAEAGGCCGHHHAYDGHHDHATAAAEPSPAAFTWRVEGMDCASCVATIDKALSRLPGISGVSVSLARETVSLDLNGDTTAGEIEALLGRLGYRASRLGSPAGSGAGAVAPRPAGSPPWWTTSKGRIATAAGLLLVVAYGIGLLDARLADAAFAVASLVAAAPVALTALRKAAAGAPMTIEMLMTVAVAGALVIGAVEEAAIVVFLFCIGEVLEGVAAEKARSGIRALAALVPQTARREVGGRLEEVPAEALAVGDVVLVRPGDRVPADGVILEGHSSLDESPITGESVPVAKGPGDKVFAGAVNAEAALRVSVEAAAADNLIARIVHLVEEAQDARAPTARFIDAFARWYMPLVVALAVAVAVAPPLLAGGDWTTWIYRGLALLLIGCPCALVISVPAAMASALSSAARNGLLVKGGAVIERLAGIDTVAFDKTGTLTVGRPAVTDVLPLGTHDTARLLALAAAVERGSSHPLAAAIAARAAQQGVEPPAASDVRALPGKGMEGTVDGLSVFVGAPSFAAERAQLDESVRASVEALEGAGKTVVVVVAGGEAAGLVALRDEPRADAAEAVAELAALGVGSVMLSGDNPRTAAAIGNALGVEARGGMLPADKAVAIGELAARRRIAMVGDGINDAPALARAHVGIAMGGGSDVALETADAALLHDRVRDVPVLLRLARATMANVRQNIAVALGLKVLFLVTTVVGATGLWMAILADTGATVLVTLNALRLLAFFRHA
jgi:copper-(or silver)-translocating P-type ATPase/heavy metal-(Cd/Co/Hg/Pb/Zn)-translocating P-type ATPase|nr:MAG: cadmium-translocating P-type ATPase [Pseudomonadota bacterium]